MTKIDLMPTTEKADANQALPDPLKTGVSPSAQDEAAVSLRSDLISHLSKEIEVHSQYLMTFRSRIAFTVLIGPFVIFGFLVTSKPTATNYWGQEQMSLSAWIAFLYLMLGFYGSRLDQHGTDQCNKWRRAMLKISAGKDIDEKDLLIPDPLLWPYVAGFFGVLLIFASIGWLLYTLLPRVTLR